ncbi:MAG: YraN family protein [Candidatus Sumerlaeota bacterium]|nr:YraN family protein [Candidatus Sumerlaeota bacterium]
MIGWLRRSRDPRHKLGVWGEEQAIRHLRRNGCRILERNFQTPQGEIDLIAERKGEILFVEVKTRASDEYGAPDEAVGEDKQRRIREAARVYLGLFRQPPESTSFDIIGVKLAGKGKPEISWQRGAF